MSNVNGESDVIPTESKTTSTVGNFSHGSRETPVISASSMEADRSEKARGLKSDMHVIGGSDSPIVPQKPANKGGVPLPAESAEGRGLTKENTGQLLLDWTQRQNADGSPSVPGRVDCRVYGPRTIVRWRVKIRGKSRMRENRTYGSARGAGSNARPYRD